MGSAVYYRDSDGVVIGSTTSEGRIDIAIELPHWGAGVSAIRAASVPRQIYGKRLRVVNASLIEEDDPEAVAKIEKSKKDRRDGINKLKDLGLTEDQIKALMKT